MSLSGRAITVGARRFSQDVLPMAPDVSNESLEFRSRITADIHHVGDHFAAMGRRSAELATSPYAVAGKTTRI